VLGTFAYDAQTQHTAYVTANKSTQYGVSCVSYSIALYRRRFDIEATPKHCRYRPGVVGSCHNGNMPRPPSTEHGTSAMYRRGCRCGPCATVERDRVRRWRHTKMTGEDRSLAAVVPLAAKTSRKSKRAGPAVVGANEAAVLAQCEAAPKAADAPGTVQQAITLARILDDEDCKAMWPTTSRQLHALLLSLAAPRGKSGGRKLAVIRAMSNRRPAGADSGAVQGD
jgi:hypothetical protein